MAPSLSSPKTISQTFSLIPSHSFSLVSHRLPNYRNLLPRTHEPSLRLKHGIQLSFDTNSMGGFRCGAILSDVERERNYRKIGSQSTGSLSANQLLELVEAAAKTGAQVVMEAVNKPRSITYKGTTDLVTEWNDKFCSWLPQLCSISGSSLQRKACSCCCGGPMCWNTRTFSAATGGGAFCNGKRIHVSATDQVEQSLLVTGFGYEHDDAWATNIDLFKEFTDISRGVRRLGAAAVDMCHVALGIVEAYWEYRLKPWDMAAGVLIVEEAGGSVTCMDGGNFCVFDRSVLVSNGALHGKLLERIGPATEKLKSKGLLVPVLMLVLLHSISIN
ncbi:phosphatase IMPL1, chloroplastic isoform X5 [Amborella trichopoda]|uniref:phosphatase IMPL1, chloroplastic isoform X5 n=1 Tax=Amborella trichopoda TaxID=13333 RepID=UPI0005D34E2D|nr:phosphatase IMPL1, chloroplastic isoform X5 [Amborella trichopoda]|eukprot:XP_011626600.1 phosphatase IMPL1, chloroplastic isoform X5 [Amborella trichopoda]